MDSQFDDAVKAAREAKIELAELEAIKMKTANTLADQRQTLAKAEEDAAGVFSEVAVKQTAARERLQAALQTINDAPVTAHAKAEAVEEIPEAAPIDADASAYINRSRVFGSRFA